MQFNTNYKKFSIENNGDKSNELYNMIEVLSIVSFPYINKKMFL